MVYDHLVRHRQFYAPGTYKELPLSNLLVEMTYTAANTKNICFNSQYRDLWHSMKQDLLANNKHREGFIGSVKQ